MERKNRNGPINKQTQTEFVPAFLLFIIVALSCKTKRIKLALGFVVKEKFVYDRLMMKISVAIYGFLIVFS